MSETPTQTRARFAEKDRVFAEREKSRKWPILECDKCRYYACPSCDKHPYYQQALACDRCGSLVVQRAVCCQRTWHHMGDCCTHCGNDERNL